MADELERDLGLVAVIAISVGAMVGSGIFILPALAVELAGPAVVLAYLLAGLLVLPAALSKSEMATAMPEAGGTYVYIERAMGPMLGTIAGLGTWFSLSFKGALALVGGVPYLVLVLDVPVTPVALGLATVLVLVNLVGAKQTGRLQIAIVGVMLAALAWFAVGGVETVEPASFDGFFGAGPGGLLAATGLVFVSYAGVTKITSVAEEVEDPGRTIPIGILGSLAFTTLLYVLVVVVVVGVVPPDVLAGSVTPVADAAEAALAQPGVVAVVIAALLALVSTANAGILSASRYPFAMSRDGLVPRELSTVSDRFDAPSTAITLTGVVLLVLVAFVPVMEIAKLASAFQILVFVLIGFAHVAFRESDLESYDPEFVAPLYPWPQIAGIGGGIILLTQMGTVPLVGAVLITVGGTAWYLAYARPRVQRDGALHETLRQSAGKRTIERTREVIDADDACEVLVALPADATAKREHALLAVADALVRDRDGVITVLQFGRRADQTPLSSAAPAGSGADVAFERRTDEPIPEFDSPVRYGEAVSRDSSRAVVDYASDAEPDLLVLDATHRFDDDRFGGDWIRRHAPCDVLLVHDDPVADVDEIGVVTTRGPRDSLTVSVATELAERAGATLRFVYACDGDAVDDRRDGARAYHEELADLCPVPVESAVLDRAAVDAVLDSIPLVLYSRDDGLVARLTGRSAGLGPDGVTAPGIEVAPVSRRRSLDSDGTA